MPERDPFKTFLSSPEIIRPTAMTCARFPFSPRNVEDLMRERGIGAGHETIRLRASGFGRMLGWEIR